MKKIIFVITLLYSLVSQAQIVCPLPEELKINIMDFTDWSTVEHDPLQKVDKHLFIGTNLIEVNNSIWYLVLGLVDENRPRLQAKQLLQRANPATIQHDDEYNEDSCVYLSELDQEIPKFISATPAPEYKPCPSLELMKATPFIHIEELCGDNPNCGEYAAMAKLEDRGNSWWLISLSYNNPSMALQDAEALKQKAYGPIIGELFSNTMCTYFDGITKEGPRGLLAIENSGPEALNKTLISTIKKNFLRNNPRSRQKLLN